MARLKPVMAKVVNSKYRPHRRFVDRPGRPDGCLPRSYVDEPLGRDYPVFEETVPQIPKTEWKDALDRLFETGGGLLQHNLWINDQYPESSCVSNATETAGRTKSEQQFGRPGRRAIKCSPMSLYRRVCSSRHSGSTCMGNLREVSARGLLPEDTPENRLLFKHVFPQNTWGISLPEGWEETGKLFQCDDWSDIGSAEGMIVAVLKGYPVVYGRAGHSICGLFAALTSSSNWSLMYAQSYGEDAGENGYQYDTLSYLERVRAQYGAWALRSTSYYYDYVIAQYENQN